MLDPTHADDSALRAAASQPLIRRRHPLQWIATIVIAVIAVQAVVLLAANPAFQWDVVGAYLFDGKVLDGLWLTVWLTFVVFALSVVLGTLITVLRMSPIPALQALAWTYVWFFRSVPLLVQLVFWFNIGYLFPIIGVGLPFLPPFIEIESRNLVSSVGVAIIALTLHEAAYAAEVVRGGLLSVPPGQREAAKAIGLGAPRTFVRIILPQALRAMLPPMGSMLIGILKATSLVSTIAIADLMSAVSAIYNRTFEVVPLLVVATAWYLVLTSALSALQWYIERRVGRGFVRRGTRTVRTPKIRVPEGAL